MVVKLIKPKTTINNKHVFYLTMLYILSGLGLLNSRIKENLDQQESSEETLSQNPCE